MTVERCGDQFIYIKEDENIHTILRGYHILVLDAGVIYARDATDDQVVEAFRGGRIEA